jgi:hypothetical protein
MDRRNKTGMHGETPTAPGSQPQGLPPDPFGRDEHQRAASYGTLRLQPVMLGPPPEPGPDDVSSADDIDLAPYQHKPRTGLIAGVIAAIAVLVTAGAAYWTLRPMDETPPVAAFPPAAVPALPVPSLPTSTPPPQGPPAASAQAPGGQGAPVDMARIDSDLVPPSTDGLTPPRRIPTLKITVENDREVVAPR